MITMLDWSLNGRSGNMIHQWAFLAALARKKGVEYVLPNNPLLEWFENKPKTGKINCDLTVKEPHYKYDQTPYDNLDYSKNINFHGHFQNEKYFDEHTREDLKLNQNIVNKVREKFGKLFNSPTIAIGIRRTDYLNLPYHQLPIHYYITALEEHFPDWRNSKLVFISDDLEYCQFHFGCLHNAYFPKSKDMEQMVLMSLCDNFIIANSTFHWWAAWLGEKPHSKVVQPIKLFAGSLLEKFGDINFYSDRWIKHEEKKIDLKDLTFTIPVFHDSTDRKENVELCISLIQRSFDTNILIGEQGGDKFQFTEQWCEYMKFDLPNFHRTKMLNDMAKASDTKFIANWDCDVFMPPMQILESVHKLRHGANMVYPYDGIFCRIMRKYRSKIFPSYDMAVFANDDYSRDTPSFGGAVLWDKQKYFEIGGENEYFISFGPEDIERMERAKCLGIEIVRVKGNLYHFNHWCGPDSSVVNPYFKQNRELLEKQRLMNAQQLLEYINSWPWHSPYTEDYYSTITEDAIRSRDAVFEILEIDSNSSVIDFGAGVCQWGVGLKNYTGVDYRVPLDKLLVDVEQFIDHDLRKPLNLGKRFDVVICVEVIEHIEEQYGDVLIDTICNAVKDGGIVLFSAAVPFQGGNCHVNEQMQTYWAKKFYDRGFGGIQDEQIANDERICDWYAQNLVIYCNKFTNRNVKDFILPRYYLEICKHLKG